MYMLLIRYLKIYRKCNSGTLKVTLGVVETELLYDNNIDT